MLRTVPAFLALSLLLSACVAPPPRPRPSPEEILVVPVGDPLAGRQAFINLSCTSCHAVLGDPSLPSPTSADRGPTFGPAQAQQQLGRLVTSIVSPSHSIPIEIRARLEEQVSPMGDFSDRMTVRQLIDLVAYLRAQGPSDRRSGDS